MAHASSDLTIHLVALRPDVYRQRCMICGFFGDESAAETKLQFAEIDAERVMHIISKHPGTDAARREIAKEKLA